MAVTVCHKSLQSISWIVKLPLRNLEFAATMIYGSNCRRVRKQLWADLHFSASSSQINHLPWTALGDFNQTLFANEHSSADQFFSPLGMKEFGQCVTSAELTDLPCIGNSFTWSNKQGDTLVSKKLDRIMVNDEWLSAFPNALGVFGDPGISDHSPCCIFLDTSAQKPKKPFKFFSMLNQNPEFIALMKECWQSLPFAGSKMLLVSKKLKALKSVIRSFSRDNYSQLELRVAEAFDDLQACQRSTLNNPTPEAALSEKSAHTK